MSGVNQAWLGGNNRRCILVEFTINKLTANSVGSDTTATGTQTLYYSTSGYLTTTSDVYYQPLVMGGLKFTESLSADGGISVTYGDIELANKNGELDAYLDNAKYIWVNGTINIYYGDPTWLSTNLSAVHSNFEQIFSGVIADIDSRNIEVLNVKVRDKLQRLNTPITDIKIGTYGTWAPAGNQTNKDSIKPIIFGEVFNVSPVLIDPAPNTGAAEFIINNGATAEVIEVRDNGVPITVLSVEPSTGTFRIANPLIGTITVDARGQNNSVTFTGGVATLQAGTYTNTIASNIALIATQWGSNPANRLTLSEIDGANFLAFSINADPIGVYITDKENTLDICNNLASSVGAQLFITRQGKLQILRYGVPTTDTSVTITTSDILLNSMGIFNRAEIRAATKIGYCKNWTVQPDLVTAIPTSHKNTYAAEWITVTEINTTTKANYKLDAEPAQIDTLLITDAAAQAEAQRINALYSNTSKTTYSFRGTTALLLLKLGQPVVLKYPRFGLNAGVTGQVVSLSPDWIAGTIDVEVLI